MSGNGGSPAVRVTVRHLAHVGLITGAGATLVVVFPRLVGSPWSTIGQTVASIPVPAVIALVAVWLVGLLAHTITLTAALPGLKHSQALLLSLTGSAVANTLPFGGAAGIAVNQRMTSRWGFSSANFASYTVVTNLWDVLAKLFLPLLLLPLVARNSGLGHHAATLLVGSALAVTGFGVLALTVLFAPGLPLLLHRLSQVQPAGRSKVRLLRALQACETVRARSAALIRAQWPRLTWGMALNTALLYVLLDSCLAVSGTHLPATYVFLAFCAERLLTLVNLTPGGLGFVEIGLATALLWAPGAHGAGVASGVLLYRLLTFGLEIPVGGAALGLRVLRHRFSTAVDGPVNVGSAA